VAVAEAVVEVGHQTDRLACHRLLGGQEHRLALGEEHQRVHAVGQLEQ